jgi:tetratricopeptide (TPR) repeat protein
MIALQSGDPEAAIDHFQRAVRSEMDRGAWHSNLGLALASANRMDDAIDEFRAALTAPTPYPRAGMNLGYALFTRGEYEEAAEASRKAIPHYGQDPRPRLLLGQCLARMGEFQRSAEIFQEALALIPNDAASHNDAAWFLASSAEVPREIAGRAAEFAETAVKLAPEAGNLRNTLGVARFRAGDFAGAIEALDESMRLRSGGDVYDWLFLAMAHHSLEDDTEARKYFDRAVEWLKTQSRQDPELVRFRSEAEQLLEVAPK